MSHYSLNEPLVTGLRSRLEASLPATITEINSTVTDGYTIVNPVQVFDFIPQAELLTAYPTIGIGDLPSTFEDDTGFAVTGRHGLQIVVFLADPDQRALAWRLRRYLQAIVTVALSNRQIGDAVGLTLRRIVPGPTLDVSRDPETWVTWAGVDIGALRFE